jgi:branched-subunit amino acid transport protein
MNIWLLMLLAGLATFATRLSFILLLEKFSMPGWFRRALRFVPITVLSAIALPELILRNEAVDISLRNPQLLSGALAILVAWRTKNVLLTILAGMAALLVFQMLFG